MQLAHDTKVPSQARKYLRGLLHSFCDPLLAQMVDDLPSHDYDYDYEEDFFAYLNANIPEVLESEDPNDLHLNEIVSRALLLYLQQVNPQSPEFQRLEGLQTQIQVVRQQGYRMPGEHSDFDPTTHLPSWQLLQGAIFEHCHETLCDMLASLPSLPFPNQIVNPRREFLIQAGEDP